MVIRFNKRNDVFFVQIFKHEKWSMQEQNISKKFDHGPGAKGELQD